MLHYELFLAVCNNQKIMIPSDKIFFSWWINGQKTTSIFLIVFVSVCNKSFIFSLPNQVFMFQKSYMQCWFICLSFFKTRHICNDILNGKKVTARRQHVLENNNITNLRVSLAYKQLKYVFRPQTINNSTPAVFSSCVLLQVSCDGI